jgi:hypothetical protein
MVAYHVYIICDSRSYEHIIKVYWAISFDGEYKNRKLRLDFCVLTVFYFTTEIVELHVKNIYKNTMFVIMKIHKMNIE